MERAARLADGIMRLAGEALRLLKLSQNHNNFQDMCEEQVVSGGDEVILRVHNLCTKRKLRSPERYWEVR